MPPARDFGLLLAVSLATGLAISLLQGVALRTPAGIIYMLMMGLLPFLFSLQVTGVVAGGYWLVRRRLMPRIRLALSGTWVLGNLLLLLDQHLAQ